MGIHSSPLNLLLARPPSKCSYVLLLLVEDSDHLLVIPLSGDCFGFQPGHGLLQQVNPWLIPPIYEFRGQECIGITVTLLGIDGVPIALYFALHFLKGSVNSPNTHQAEGLQMIDPQLEVSIPFLSFLAVLAHLLLQILASILLSSNLLTQASLAFIQLP